MNPVGGREGNRLNSEEVDAKKGIEGADRGLDQASDPLVELTVAPWSHTDWAFRSLEGASKM